MLVLLLVMLHPGLCTSSTASHQKSETLHEYVDLFEELFTGLIHTIRDERDPNMNHIAGLRQIADKAEELATKAANAAVFVTTEIYETEPTERTTLLEPLETVLHDSPYSRISVENLGTLRAFNGSTFGGIGTEVLSFMENAQLALGRRYVHLERHIESIRNGADVSSNRGLTELCTSPVRFGTTMCMLQVYGSIFGSNCSASYSSLCAFNQTYFDIDTSYYDRWTAPHAIYGCVNERIARLSNNESTLNRLAMYAKRNVFLAFNFIAFCTALREHDDGFSRDAVQIVRSIAHGFALSQKEINTSSWPHLAKVMAAKKLSFAALKFPRDEADETYNQTAHDIVKELKYTWVSHGYSAVVYYAYTGLLKSDVVFYNGSNEDSFNVTSEMIKAFIKRYNSDDEERVAERWKSVKVDPKTLAELFDDDEISTSMAERFRMAKLDAKLFVESGFRAAAVLPCGYRFVWYELAWQYFDAYGTTSSFVLKFRGENAYKPCGAVVLFP